jgi:ABC-type oligopeptide transport system ATPase subunit
MSDGRPLLEVRNLQTQFFTRAGVVKAVDGVSFTWRAARSWAWSASPARASR